MTKQRDDALNAPLRCRPLLKPKIWGGRGLQSVLGKHLPPDEPIGESWEVADVPQGTSGIAGGPLDGLSLRELMQCYGDRLFRGSGDGSEFPLLVKFIDAQDDISIQVHPSAEVCARLYPAERAKDETWLVVHAEPGAAVLHGVRDGVSLDEIRRRIPDGSIVEVMRRIEVAPGDVIHLPAGTLHALLRGVMLLEVQEPSDSTFRVYDHDRLDSDGCPRALHVQQALESLHVEPAAACIVPTPRPRPWGLHELLIDSASYRMARLTLEGRMNWESSHNAAEVIVVVAGDLVARWGGEEDVFRTGETFIVPPELQALTLAPLEERCQVVVATPRCNQHPR